MVMALPGGLYHWPCGAVLKRRWLLCWCGRAHLTSQQVMQRWVPGQREILNGHWMRYSAISYREIERDRERDFPGFVHVVWTRQKAADSTRTFVLLFAFSLFSLLHILCWVVCVFSRQNQWNPSKFPNRKMYEVSKKATPFWRLQTSKMPFSFLLPLLLFLVISLALPR